MLNSLFALPNKMEAVFNEYLPKVVDDFGDEELTPNQKNLLSYFKKKQGSKSFFSRRDFNPVEVKQFLPKITI